MKTKKALANMNKKMMWLLQVPLLATLFSCGCASHVQNLPRFTGAKPPPDKALVVLERKGPALSWWYRWNAYDNKTLVGKVADGGTLVWLRDPGPMDLYFVVGFIGRHVDTEAGETYYIKYGPGIDDWEGSGIPKMINP